MKQEPLLHTAPAAGASLLRRARECLAIEGEAIAATSAALDDRFVAVVGAVEQAFRAGRRLIFSGVGKNAAIAQKLSSTFASTGVASAFLDAGQALHGDLGVCVENDLAFLLSNSGQTEEILRLLPPLKRLGVKTVALTGRPDSELARHCDWVLPYRAPREACPLQLAPTASTTAALALGDALAMAFLELRGFTRDDFARYHPGGALGQRLLLSVREIMRTGDRLALLPETATVQEALLAMTKAKCGTAAVLESATGRLAGVFTDGDFRRLMLADPARLFQPVAPYLTRRPKTVSADVLAVEAIRIFEQHQVNDLIALDADGRPVGLVDGQDLPKLRLV